MVVGDGGWWWVVVFGGGWWCVVVEWDEVSNGVILTGW